MRRKTERQGTEAERQLAWSREYPVSYTHLDVYKRQRAGRGMNGTGFLRQCAEKEAFNKLRQALLCLPYFLPCLLYTSRCV